MALRRIIGSRKVLSAALSGRALSSAKSASLFYEVGGAEKSFAPGSTVVGEKSSGHVLDLKSVRPGDVIEVPYELTISPSFRDFWQSTFYAYDRINTSTTFSRSLGLQDQVVPFTMMLYFTGAMSHAYDHAIFETIYSNCKYHWPGIIFGRFAFGIT
jgi:hypothetical protein